MINRLINRFVNFRSIILLSIDSSDESERNYLYFLLSLNTIVTFACFFFFFFNQIHDLSRINNPRDSKMEDRKNSRFEELIVKRKKKKRRARERVCDDRLRKQNNRIGKRGMRHSIPRSCQVKSQGQGHHWFGSIVFVSLPCSFFLFSTVAQFSINRRQNFHSLHALSRTRNNNNRSDLFGTIDRFFVSKNYY